MTLEELKKFCEPFKGIKYGYYSAEKDRLMADDIIANETFCWTLYDSKEMRYLQSVRYYQFAAEAMNALPKLLAIADTSARFLEALGDDDDIHRHCSYERRDLDAALAALKAKP